MKGIILALVVVTMLAVPTMLGFIPAVIGAPAMLLVVLLKDVILMVLARGLPMAMITARMMGGYLWGIMDKSNNINVGRPRYKGGMTFTKKHGAYNVVTEGGVKLDGVPFYISPEEVGFNVKLVHLELLAKLKERGVNNILEIIDVNEQNQFKNFKDDQRINDLKDELRIKLEPGLIDNLIKPRVINLPGLNDYHRYVTESAHPFRQDANIQIGVAQEARNGKQSHALIWVAVIMVVGLIGLGLLFLLMGRGGETVVIIENAGRAAAPVIPA